MITNQPAFDKPEFDRASALLALRAQELQTELDLTPLDTNVALLVAALGGLLDTVGYSATAEYFIGLVRQVIDNKPDLDRLN